jgi:signal transduction histidine kinase
MRRPSVLTLLVGTMLVLLPVLASLQFRWLGQLSDAERERLQRNLRATTGEFTHAIDLEVARVLVGLQVDGATLREGAWDRYGERYAAWQAATAYPALVAGVWLADEAPGRHPAVRLRRWSPETRSFEPAEWPVPLAAVRDQVAAAHATYTQDGEPAGMRPSDVVSADASLLVIPVVPAAPPRPDGSAGRRLMHVFGFTIVELSRSVLDRQVIPALVARHFGAPGDPTADPSSSRRSALDYHVAVVDKERPADVIYESEPGDARALQSRADASADFFGMRPDQFALMRQAFASLRLPPRPGDTRRGFVSVFTRRAEPGQRPGPPEDGARWRLLVRHRAGSLEAAVSRARRRNLALSFGILVLMAGSVGLIVVAAQRAQALARQQMEFVAGVSHELRTPVSVIGVAADNLARGVVSDPGRVRQYGATIQTEARRLGETVERVLQFAGIHAGRPAGPRTPVSAAAILDDVLEASRQLIAESGAAVERVAAPNLPPVLADAAALRSALQNLVGNALKYGGPAPSVRVTAGEVQARGRTFVEIAVSDKGIGIPPAEQSRIFEPFYRGSEALARQIHGNGLGLSIVRRIVEAHGGRVTVTSAPGAGSTFTMRLPAAEGEPIRVPGAVERQAHG